MFTEFRMTSDKDPKAKAKAVKPTRKDAAKKKDQRQLRRLCRSMAVSFKV